MATLSRDLRRELERVIVQARRVGVEGAIKGLEQLAVANDKPWPSMTDEQKRLRVRLRAHGRQLGDKIDARGGQSIRHLAKECAYEHWHRMLFARFLAESNLLIEPQSGVAISLDECRELARQHGKDWLLLASEFAVRMLPQIFRSGDPVLEISLPPETRNQLEALLQSLSPEVFAADDSLGWVYQFWQSEEKKRVNESDVKIGADELPAVTELFTEDYMVLFLLHNTLGAWWTAKRKAEGKDPNLPDYEWTYLRLKEDGTPAAGSFDGWPRAAKDIKVLDPSMGSGHFLVFALPILVGFRMEEESLSREQAVEAVLRDNLFGLEIDPRCTQIAPFNLAWTAWRMVGYRPLPQMNLACSGLGINASEDDWAKLAGRDSREQETMRRLYALFKDAPTLGSLIDPLRFKADLYTAAADRVLPLLEEALKRETLTEEAHELAIVAQGLLAAFRILTGQFTLVSTNVPYLGRGKQDPKLAQHCAEFHVDAKADLATCFVDRCLRFCDEGTSVALVTPQNWLFLTSYKKLRERLLKGAQWDFVARLGPRAFETISGEVVNVALLLLTRALANGGHKIAGLDGLEELTPEEKRVALRISPIASVGQEGQLQNPDCRIVLEEPSTLPLLRTFANGYVGLQNGDTPRFIFSFWELPQKDGDWEFFQLTTEVTGEYLGREGLLRWQQGRGELASAEGARVQGTEAWGKNGVAVRIMGDLPCTLYSGEFYDQSSTAIIPRNDQDLPAIWVFCSSSMFRAALRKIDQKVNVTNATFVKVPFDLHYWRGVAKDHYPDGLPKPYSRHPTQWLFNGHPKDSEHPFQVAVARLLGYRWPRQTGSSFPDCPALDPDGLEKQADSDGIVCLNPVAGQRASAPDRLRALLAEAYGDEWSAAELKGLLGDCESLEAWLRDRFFEDHCRTFHQRPFVWHIWDGLRDGFHAFVNYHKLGAPNGAGRQTLQKLTYSYLGDWIERQRANQKNGVDGADGRLAAALHLKKELEKILEGEPPYDIFVRWKPVYEQPLGWEPDINDGVRINIRPFMMAGTIKGNKNGCILRVTPKIKWQKDRGKEPHRPKEDFPWFWKWDGKTENFSGGHEFDGNRWNDLHYSLEKKHEARRRHGSGKQTNEAKRAVR